MLWTDIDGFVEEYMATMDKAIDDNYDQYKDHTPEEWHWQAERMLEDLRLDLSTLLRFMLRIRQMPGGGE